MCTFNATPHCKSACYWDVKCTKHHMNDFDTNVYPFILGRIIMFHVIVVFINFIIFLFLNRNIWLTINLIKLIRLWGIFHIIYKIIKSQITKLKGFLLVIVQRLGYEMQIVVPFSYIRKTPNTYMWRVEVKLRTLTARGKQLFWSVSPPQPWGAR